MLTLQHDTEIIGFNVNSTVDVTTQLFDRQLGQLLKAVLKSKFKRTSSARTAYYIHGLKLMKLNFAVLDVLLTMGLTRCYKTKVFFYIYTI